MKRTYMVLAAAATMLGTACATRQTSVSTGDVEMGSSAAGTMARSADLRGIEGWNALRGSVYARPMPGGTQLALTVGGGIPGSRYIWDVREGTCGSNGQIVGGAAGYMAVELGQRGTGNTITDLTTTLDAGKDYSVNLYASATERTLVIACGRLAR